MRFLPSNSVHQIPMFQSPHGQFPASQSQHLSNMGIVAMASTVCDVIALNRWSRIIGTSQEIPGKEWAGQELVISPPEKLRGDGSWVSVDGEKYEAVPMHVRLKPQHLTLYSPLPP